MQQLSQLRPMLSTLRRHKTAASLIVLEIALTSAIIINALHLIGIRITALTADNGVPEAELVMLAVRDTGGAGDASEISARDMQALRALPGVKSVAIANQVIYGDSSNNSGVRKDPAQDAAPVSAAAYAGTEDLLQTMGLKLLAGRDFKPEEFQSGSVVGAQSEPRVGQIIINRALAEKLFAGQAAVGQLVYVFGDTPSVVIGVVDQLSHPKPRLAGSSEGYAMLWPIRPSFRGGNYLLRVDPAQRDALLKAATAALEQIDTTRIVSAAQPLTEMRRTYYAQDRSMAWLLGSVIVALLLVTAFGIVGLASFWVQQRTRMIGIRRALGASQGQIQRYFQAENFLLSSVGIALGMAGALGLSLVLMESYELPRLPWIYLPVGAVVLWTLGQLAVLAPARRAAKLPPMAAMRG